MRWADRKKSLPAWPEVPASAWACWHCRVQSLHVPRPGRGPHPECCRRRKRRGRRALDLAAAKCWAGREIRVATPLETWVDESAKLTKTDRVEYCEGSEAEYQ